MFYFSTPHFKPSVKAMLLALYLLGNGLAIVVFSQEFTQGVEFNGQETIKSHLCAGHLPLMTNITPDIRC